MRIRQFQAGDREAIYAVSLATGFRGGDASHLYDDGSLIGHIYSAPYAHLEPELALVVEDDEGVGGFAVGVINTQEWEERLELDWWPQLRARYPRPAGPPSEWSVDKRRAAMIHAPERTPRSVSIAYPTHLHVNLLPRFQGRGIGSGLLRDWLVIAHGRGAKAVHVGVNSENTKGLRFWARSGFRTLDIDGGSTRTVWMGRSMSLA
jgi:ribosomal protein S18 acetylase RimI-like enzyme